MGQMPPPPPKLRTIREEVWIAQSDLFLDTDVRLNYAYVARVAADSPFSDAELEAIFRDEVAPIVESNLLEIAGEWAMFPAEWLIDSITARLASQPRVPYRMDTSAMDDWRAVAHLVRCLRRLPAEARMARSRLWEALRPLFLDREPEPPAELAAAGAALLEQVFREEMLPAYGASVEAYARHNATMYPTREGLEARWRLWLERARGI